MYYMLVNIRSSPKVRQIHNMARLSQKSLLEPNHFYGSIKWCETDLQQFVSSGIGTDAHAIAEIQTTLKQFSTIKKVVILTQDSHCFGDESGADMCLH
jgi:archaellum biogenesis ATPase FlaH